MIIRSMWRIEWSYEAQYSETRSSGSRSVGDVDIFRLNVDVVEELLVDAVVAALLFGRPDRVELVEAVNGDVPEADLSLRGGVSPVRGRGPAGCGRS